MRSATVGNKSFGFEGPGPYATDPSKRPAPEYCRNTDSDQEKSEIYFLDAVVAGANTLTILGVSYKPYWIMSDAATVAALAYAWVFSKRFVTVSGVGLALALVFALLVYKVVRKVKAMLGKSAARSFLQDCVLIIIPSFLLASFLFKQPLTLIFAFLGTLLPLYGCLARVGCFLGGCCYGRPSANGVFYPGSIFEAQDHDCRAYSPSPNPGVRVFPIQLVEAVGQATLFVTLAILVWQVPTAAGSVFFLYLSLYAVMRFVLDFFRTTSARPRYWRFSEAQLVCATIGTASVAALVHGVF